ncbi:MAG: hypothetical protein E7D28_09405 [Clostridium sp.]|uniref:hypothetical protein n=1 Tax=Clostridium TaxID=1485 RepID=UPI00019AFCB5|nr:MULTISPECIES: hypothetical protein [Clostridium]EEH97667.1 hypothetical protein CSBG_01293 [Clostridium sp. 7_2_43FAA]MDB1969398.1 hypothetical protein [Clostridium tertium]MDU1278313.1 hypothetical protein [Clostridium sp.]MDU2460167.1 hypothetical protein [Clostridium sp.]MDU2680810.1 hypothetical protein [Clostridium sp.]
MKKYLRNKNFIPNEFIERLDLNENKKNNQLISILILLNIIIIPTSVNKILQNKEYKEVYNNNNNNLESNLNIEERIKKENIEEWINNITPNILYMNIQNNNGSIKVKNKEEVFKIEENDKIKINSIIKNEENYFTLEVRL